MARVGVVIPAGGKGLRLGRRTPKQFLKLEGVTILERTVAIFHGMREVSEIVIPVPSEFVRRTERMIQQAGFTRAVVAIGGRERQQSVWNGLRAFTRAPEIVLVHDAVRPLATRQLVRRVIRSTRRHGAAIAASRVKDTVKVQGRGGRIKGTLDRTALWAAQTPQGFRFQLLRRAHEAARRAGVIGTDEAFLVERIGKPVWIVEGGSENIKITTVNDLRLARALLLKSQIR